MQSNEPGRLNALSFSGVLWVAGICAVVAGALLLALKIIPYTVHLSTVDLREVLDPVSLPAKFLLNCIWIVLLLLGVLVGILHGWFKEEGILKSGLDELRDWRERAK
jgi:hypothetical protein